MPRASRSRSTKPRAPRPSRPPGKIAEPQEAAAIVLFLALANAGSVKGAEADVDGSSSRAFEPGTPVIAVQYFVHACEASF